MIKLKIKKGINYILGSENNYSLEHRLLLSALVLGALLGFLSSIGNIFLTNSLITWVVPFCYTILTVILYYFARFKNKHENIALIATIVGIIGISVIWIFNGGINGPNFMFSLAFLILGLIIVPNKTRNFIVIFFILANIFIMLIQLYKPEIIEPYPTEFARWIDSLVSLIFSTIFIFLIIRFIHENYAIERQRAEENERKLKLSNNDKDRFISVLAHDLKNPFNSLLGFTNLLNENLHKYDIKEIEKQLNIIHKTTQVTFNLLEDLLLWSGSQSGNFTIVPQKIVFSEVCNEMINNLKNQAKAKEISIDFFESENIILRADLNMFKTVLRNLITNAVKFTRRNGQINISIKKNQKDATIIVSDNGIGIDKEHQSKLWDFKNPLSTFDTSGEKGTGFGLLLCKEFIEKNDGRIWVESDVEKGSDFKFTIPIA